MGLYLPLFTDHPHSPYPLPLGFPVPAMLLPKYIKHYSCLCTDLFLWNILPPDTYLTCSFTSFRSAQMSLPQKCLHLKQTI